MPELHTGGCLCGAIRYRIAEAPLRTGICHCLTCQKFASAPSLPFTVFPAATFVFETGEPVDFASSPGVVRAFCGRCGTGLTYRNDRQPGALDVMTITLDHPDRYPPTHHVWVSQKPAWHVIGDALPQHAKS